MNSSLRKNLESYKNILVTGGAGFIGGAMIRTLLNETRNKICNFDKLGYASDLYGTENLIYSKTVEEQVDLKSRYKFVKGDLKNPKDLEKIFNEFKPNLVFHFAAESHVDRSIDYPDHFLDSNIIGTFNLLETIRKYKLSNLQNNRKEIKLIHISTDEVFGTVEFPRKFNEESKYDPRSPYSASKASSDHLVNAWVYTYGIKALTTNCCNNYGPWQFPEKLIPLTILKALNNQYIPIYGNGENVREWIFVEDHINALLTVATRGEIGKKYCIGSSNEISNIKLVKKICSFLDQLTESNKKHESLIKFVEDRCGHDKRYSIDSSLISNELGWEANIDFDQGLYKTIKWYLSNLDWCKKVWKKNSYNGERLGRKSLN